MEEKLSQLEIDLYNASVDFIEMLNETYKDSVFDVKMNTVLGSDTRRSIVVSYLRGIREVNCNYQLNYVGNSIQFPEKYNTDNAYKNYIMGSVYNVINMIE